MSTSTALTTDTIRIRNKATGRGMWLVTNEDGNLTTSEVNSDRRYCPYLLVDPVSTPAVAVFTTGVPTTATLQFDGLLGSGSTVTSMGSGTIASVSAATWQEVSPKHSTRTTFPLRPP
jgi:hypothetical protein